MLFRVAASPRRQTQDDLTSASPHDTPYLNEYYSTTSLGLCTKRVHSVWDGGRGCGVTDQIVGMHNPCTQAGG